MRLQLMGLALALTATTAFAQPINENPPTKTIQCIDVGGDMIPPLCDVPASRLDSREYICTCPNGGQRLEVSICAKGQKPPPEGRALNRARREGMRDGSLVGDMIGDRQICVAPRHG